MSKFFFADLDQLVEIEKMVIDRDRSKTIVLHQKNGYADIVRYSPKYETAVFLTIPETDL